MGGLPLSFQMESIVFVILSSALISIGGKAMADCSDDDWSWRDSSGRCVPCSKCPENQIVLKTCSDTSDTVCGPFKDFQMFQGSNTLKLYHETKPETTAKPAADEKVLRREAEERNGHWHTITMVMVAVLCVAGILFAAFIVAVCYRCRKQDKESLMMQVDRDSDFEKLDVDVPTTSTGRTGAGTFHSPGHTRSKKVEQFEIAMESENT